MSDRQYLQPTLLPFADSLSSTSHSRRSKQRERDPLLDHAAVKLYREVCHLWPNHVQRRQIAGAVGDSAKALALYREVLTQFMVEGQPKQRADWTVERFQKAQRLMEQQLATQSDNLVSPAAIKDRVWRFSLALAEAADAWRGRQVDDKLCRALEDAASQLHAMQNRIGGSLIDARSVEESLAVTDNLINLAVFEAASPAELEAAQKHARDHLKPYREQMEVVAYNGAEERLVLRQLREHFQIPRISLCA
jgi:hypothetical protein